MKYIVVYSLLVAGLFLTPAKAQKPSLSLLGPSIGQYHSQAAIDTCFLGDSLTYPLPADSLRQWNLLKPPFEELLPKEPQDKKRNFLVLNRRKGPDREKKRIRISASWIVKSLHPARMLLITPHKQTRYEY